MDELKAVPCRLSFEDWKASSNKAETGDRLHVLSRESG
jgi:hypothetical protein